MSIAAAPPCLKVMFDHDVLDVLPEGVALLDADLRVVVANSAFAQLLGMTAQQAVGGRIDRLGGGRWSDRGLLAALGTSLSKDERLREYEMQQDLPGAGRRTLLFSASPVMEAGGKFLFLAVRDMTELRRGRHAVQVLEGLPDVVARFSLEGRCLYANAAAGRLTGRPSEELEGKTVDQFGVASELVAAINAAFGRIVRTKRPEILPSYFGGQRFLLQVFPEFDSRGGVASFATVSRDVTAFERTQERYRLLYDTMKQGVVHQNAEGRIISANPAALRILGKTPEEFLGSSSEKEEKYTVKEDGAPCPAREHPSMVALRTGRGVRGAVMGVYNAREKLRRWIRVDAIPLLRPGEKRPYEVYTLFDDITERRKTEEALKINAARFQRMVDSNIYGIAIADFKGNVLEANDYYLGIIGYTREELERRKVRWEELTPSTYLDRDYRAIGELKERGVCSPYEREYHTREGERKWVLIADAVLPGPEPQIVAFVLDITARKKTEQELLELKTSFTDIFQASPAVMVISGRRDGRYREVNRAFEQVSGYARDEVIGRSSRELRIFSEMQEREEILRELREKGRVYDREIVFRGKGGREIIGLASIIEMTFRHEPCLLFVGVDITRRKKVEDALLRSERDFRALSENSPDFIARMDRENRFTYINPYGAALYGKPREMIVGNTNEELGVPRENSLLYEQMMNEVFATGERRTFETGLTTAERRQVTLLVSYVPEFDEQVKPVSILVIGRDITPLKEAERRLTLAVEEAKRRADEAEEGNRILASVLDSVPEGFTIADAATGRLRAVSRYLAEFAGLSRESFNGASMEEYLGRLRTKLMTGEPMKPEDAPLWRALHRGETITDEQYLMTNLQGEDITILINTALIRDARGRIIGALSVWRNISALKRVEDELRASRDTAERRAREAEEGRSILESIMNNIPEGIMIVDEDNRIRLISAYMARITGISPRQMQGMDVGEIEERLGEAAVEEGAGAAAGEYPVMRALHRGETIIGEERVVRTADGSVITITINAQPVRSADGRIIGAVTSWRDISDRKKAEDTLRRNEYELRTLVDNSPDLIFRFNREMRYVYVNPAYERVAGIPKERMLGSTNGELGMPSELVAFWRRSLGQVLEAGRESSLEFSMQSFFGERYFAARLIPEFARSGLVETVLVIARDVTERRQAEEQIRYISFHDEVTGLFNRAFFEEELRRVDTERDLPVSIIMGDVNNLKLSNDVFGHNEGDMLLRTIADSIRNACRKNDIVARWGGDEFAVILPRTDEAAVAEVVGRIRQNVRQGRGTALQPSIALGCATKERREENIYRVIRKAEERMYDNKLDESVMNEEFVITSLQERARERGKGLEEHLERSGALAERFAGDLGLSDEQRVDLLLLIRLHALGDAVLPRELLTKPGRLTAAEWDTLKKQPEAGFRVVKSFADTARISDEMYSHGERWDGSGYPRGLRGKEIPYLARIFAIIDAWDAMTHERPYARPLEPAEALEELRRSAGRQFDPELAERFIGMLSREPVPA